MIVAADAGGGCGGGSGGNSSKYEQTMNMIDTPVRPMFTSLCG